MESEVASLESRLMKSINVGDVPVDFGRMKVLGFLSLWCKGNTLHINVRESRFESWWGQPALKSTEDQLDKPV